MKFSKKITIIFLVTVSVISFSAQAQRAKARNVGGVGSWRILGTTHAKHTADHDAINVTGTHDFYRKLKLKVTDSPLNITKMIVRYDDGAPENINIR